MHLCLFTDLQIIATITVLSFFRGDSNNLYTAKSDLTVSTLLSKIGLELQIHRQFFVAKIWQMSDMTENIVLIVTVV